MVYQFGSFELDDDRFELRRGGETVRVEPRVFETIAYLVRNRQRVVTKDELIEGVWKVKFVSDSALARCIMEARRSLGGAAGGGGWVTTVHGRGWRFVAEVTERRPASDPTPPPLAAVDALPAPVPAAPPLGPRYRQARRLLRVAIPIALAVVAAGAWRLSGGLRSAGARPEPAARPSLALLPVSVAEDDREMEMLGLSVTDLLAARLARVPDLLLRDADTATPRALEAGSIAGLAQALGVEHVLTGTLRRVGPARAHLDLTLVDLLPPRSARTLPMGSYDLPLLSPSTDVAEFARVRDSIAHDLLGALLPALELTAGDAPAPHSLEGYRLYLLAQGYLAAGEGSGEAAVSLLEQSLRLDPDFAPGWTLLGWAKYDLASFGGMDGGHYRQALEAADRALELAAGSPQALVLKAVVMTETGRAEEAYAMLESASARSPRRAELHYFRSYPLRFAGCLQASRRALETARAFDPIVASIYGGAPTVYLYLGDDQRFLANLPGVSSPLYAFYRGLAAWRRGDHEETRRQLGPAFAMAPGDVFARLSEALLAIEEEHPANARLILEQLALQRERLGSGDGEVTFKIGQLLAAAGADDEAVAALRRAVEQGFFCPPCLYDRSTLGPLFARPDFQAVVAAARTRHLAFAQRFGLEHGEAATSGP